MSGWLGSLWPKEKKVTFVNGVQVTITAPARLENTDDSDVRFAYLFSGSIGTHEAADITAKRGQQKAIFTTVAIPDDLTMLAPWTMAISGFSKAKLDVVVDPDSGDVGGRLRVPMGLLNIDEALDVRFGGRRDGYRLRVGAQA